MLELGLRVLGQSNVFLGLMSHSTNWFMFATLLMVDEEDVASRLELLVEPLLNLPS